MASLFGATPQEVLFNQFKEDEKMQMLRNQQYAQEAQPFGVFAPLYQASRKFGDMGSAAVTGSLFPEMVNPQLAKAQKLQSILGKYQQEGVSLTDPATLKQLGGELITAGLGEEGIKAITLGSQLTKEKKLTTVPEGSTVIDESGNIVLEGTPKGVSTPANFASVANELGFGVRKNLGDYSQEETQRINSVLEARGIRKAEAGVPKPGEVKITDLKGAQDIVDNLTKAPKDRLNSVRQIRVSLGEVKQGTGAALPQLRRDLIKLVGDNQIGQGEVQQALGSIGIVGDAISGINQLFTGTPSPEKLKDVEKFVNSLEEEHAKSYNRGREAANKVLEQAKLSPDTVKTLVPPAYKTGKEQKKSAFVEGKIYKDAQGNRARYVNGAWQPVQ
jgi:hypothetical protein